MWFTNFANDSIGRVTTSGTVTNYTGPGIIQPYGIVAGPDGALWFTNSGSDSIGRITTSGTVTIYHGPDVRDPLDIAVGPDGALWFTNDGHDSIGRITTSGTVTDYTGTGIHDPVGITAGPDGALWFTSAYSESGSKSGSGCLTETPPCGSIGRITTGGKVTKFSGTGIYDPGGIVAGPDGAMWFTDGETDGMNNSIGRITTAGTVTNYTDPSIDAPDEIVAGPDGALWFTNRVNGSIGRITTAGTVTNYTGPGLGPTGRHRGRSRWGVLVHQRRDQLDRADHHVGDGDKRDRARDQRARPMSRPVPTGRCGSPARGATRSGGSPPRGRCPPTPGPGSTVP